MSPSTKDDADHEIVREFQHRLARCYVLILLYCTRRVMRVCVCVCVCVCTTQLHTVVNIIRS